jgi:mono/diheme cytochrome c family protein
MKFTIDRVKALVIGLAVLLAIAMIWYAPVAQPARAANDDQPPADIFAAKCKMCHGDVAQKFFDTTLTDDQMIEAIMKGKKGEKPPFMPAFEPKGLTAEQAKAMVDYMRTLKH